MVTNPLFAEGGGGPEAGPEAPGRELVGQEPEPEPGAGAGPGPGAGAGAEPRAEPGAGG